jgi:hypothetical protein
MVLTPSNPDFLGHQGSETTRAQVTIYTHKGDPAIAQGGEAIEFSGKSERGENPALMQVSTSKRFGQASGNWTVTCKVPRSAMPLWERVADDDWADISFSRHGRVFHVMRGLVSAINTTEATTGSGATTTVFTITGQDHGKVWEKTPVWFSTFCRENVHGHFAAKVFTTKRADGQDSAVAGDSLVLGSPAAAVRGYMMGFLEELGNIGRENWQLPEGMPGASGTSFVQNLLMLNADFSNTPERFSIDPNFIMQGGTLWDLAQEWSDPLFTELWLDLLPNGDYPNPGEEQPIEDSQLAIIYRDRMLPIVAPEWEGLSGKDSPYFFLPTFDVPRSLLKNRNVGRSGHERFNAFFVSSPLHQEAVGQYAVDLLSPLWDKESIRRHGLRRFDVSSKYGSKAADLLNIAEQQRAIIRDWYCMNPYLLSGTLELGRLMPDVRIGCRVRIPGRNDNESEETYYIEGVDNVWQPARSATTLSVTRGWIGTEDQYLETLQNVVDQYILEPKTEAGRAAGAATV